MVWHITDSALPTGAFSYSQGLEAAHHAGRPDLGRRHARRLAVLVASREGAVGRDRHVVRLRLGLNDGVAFALAATHGRQGALGLVGDHALAAERTAVGIDRIAVLVDIVAPLVDIDLNGLLRLRLLVELPLALPVDSVVDSALLASARPESPHVPPRSSRHRVPRDVSA